MLSDLEVIRNQEKMIEKLNKIGKYWQDEAVKS